MNKIVLLFLILPCWGYSQLTPLECPLEKWEVPGKASHQGEATEQDLRAFISDTLKLARVNRSFKPNHKIANFELKKEPGFPIYELHFHPAVASLALKGQKEARLLPLYLLLHAIAHTDLKHETANEAAADKKAGEWMGRLGVEWGDVEDMLKYSGLADRRTNLKAGYLQEREIEVVNKPASSSPSPPSGSPAGETPVKAPATSREILRQKSLPSNAPNATPNNAPRPRRQYPVFPNVAPRSSLLC